MDFLIQAGPTKLTIFPELPKPLFLYIRKKLTYIMKGFEYTKFHKEFGWDGRICKFSKNQTAPAGYVYRVRKAIESQGYKARIEYINNYEPRGSLEIHGLTLADFQVEAVKRALKYRRGIISAPVRAGKTAIASAIINSIAHYPVWVFTAGKDLVKQTRLDLENHLQRSVGIFSESEYSPGDVIVSSYQAIGHVFPKKGDPKSPPKKILSKEILTRNSEILQSLADARVLLLDECHHMLAPVNSRILEHVPNAGYVLGLSGTPNPTGRHYLEMEAAIGSIINKVKYETLINRGRLAKPKIVIYQLPYSWFQHRGLTSFDDVYEASVVENLPRNQFISDLVKGLSRQGKTCYIMIRRLHHGPLLRNLIPGSMFLHGAIPSETRKEIYKSLMDKNIKCIISTVGKEGLNLPSLDVVINAEGYNSKVTTVQKMRSLTAFEGKEYGIIIDFLDRGKYLNKHSKKRIDIYSKIGSAEIVYKQVRSSYFPEIKKV
jgi:superfamily II DNA or RNA helicase